MEAINLKKISISVLLILLIPFVAMQFTTEVNWSLNDFIVAAVLLGGAGICLDLITKKVNSKKYKFLFLIATLLVFLLIWIELAVGVFGTPFSGN